MPRPWPGSAGNRLSAEAVTQVVEESVGRAAGAPSAEGAALRCRGLLEDDPDVLLSSVEAYRRGPRPFDRALACEDAAAALGRGGRREEAVPLFEEALSAYERLGALRDVARATATMRDLGLPRGARRPRRRPSSGWEGLTPAELKVVQLVAEGLTNGEIAKRLFISRYTVETHLKHVFAKLGLSSRVEVAAEAARRGKG